MIRPKLAQFFMRRKLQILLMEALLPPGRASNFLDSKLQTCSHGKTYIESIYPGVLQVWLGGITNLYLLFYEPIFSSFSKNTHGHESPSSKKHDIDDQNYFLKYAVKRYIFMIKLRYMMIHKFVYLQNA